MSAIRHIVHPFAPIIDGASRVLILGSVPSVKSVERGFFYMHPQNRFWKIMSAVCGLDLINCSHEEKQSALLKNRIALYDAVCECDIEGSSDSSVKNIKPADIKTLIAGADIKKILCNGTLSFSLTRQNNPALAVPIIKMPSTSPANAKTAYAELERMWLGELLLI